MAESRSKFVERVSIEYMLNGASLDTSLNNSQQKWIKAHKKANKFTESETKLMITKLEEIKKGSLFRMEKAERASIRKQIKEEKLLHNQALRQRYSRFKKFYKDKASAEKQAETKAVREAKALHKRALAKRYSRFVQFIKQKAAAEKQAELKAVADAKALHKRKLKSRYNRWKAYHKKKRTLASEAAAKERADEKKNRSGALGGFSNFGSRIGTIASYGAAVVILNALRQALTFVVTKTIEFEKAFTDLAVKSGYTNREMSKVTKTIFNVAAATKFSTLDIVSGATALGKLGFEAKEVVKILPNVANVAGATGESLENTAKVFGKVTNAYSLGAEQAQYVSDLLVDTFNNSALDVEKFNTAFSYVGAAAASTGTSLTELTKAMAILSDRGVTASKVGTGLRNIFTKLGREGDTLRDIIARVNKENLSFYEIAELVGRRAANQLFILMDSVGEFDQAIADSADSFGAAWEANAKQMSTFSAKWDIFMNNITNKVAELEFDADETFRQSLVDTIDLMTKLNALKFFNKNAADITVFNLAAQDKDFISSLAKIRKEIVSEGILSDDEDVEQEIAKRYISGFRNAIEDKQIVGVLEQNYNEFGKAKPADLTKENLKLALSDLQKELYYKKADEIKGVASFFNQSDGDSVIKTLDKWDKGLELNKKSIELENYVSELTTLTGFISQFNTQMTNKFNAAIRYNDRKAGEEVINELIKSNLASPEDLKKLKYVLDNNALLTEDLKKSLLRDKNQGTALDRIVEEGAGFRELITNLSGDGGIENVKRDDRVRFDKAVADRKAWEQSICSKYETDSAYKYVIDKENIICPSKKGTRKLEEIEKIDRNKNADEDYKRKRNLLEIQYEQEKDPELKLKINDKLLDLEEKYRFSLQVLYAEYFMKMERIRDAYIKRNGKKGQIAFDKVVDDTKDFQYKEQTDGVVQEQKLNNRDLEGINESYKRSERARAVYQQRLAKKDKEIKLTDRKDKETRQKLFKERNDIIETYLTDEEKRIDLHYTRLAAKIKRIEAANLVILSGGGGSDSVIDTTKLKKQLSKRDTDIEKARADKEKEKEKKLKKEDGEKEDVFPYIMQAYDDVYSVYAQIGDMKLEQVKQQNERELALISERYDNEKAIVDASLNAGIVSQEQAQEANERLRKKKIDAENKANKTLFEAQKKRDKEEAIFTGISSTAQAIAAAFARDTPVVATVMAAISAAAISASTAMNIGAISKRKFVPQKYADGGLIEGKSHAQGGVPFTVSGYGGFEAEGGEYIVNKEATRNNLAELERINGKTRTGKRKYATGGIVSADDINSNGFNEALLEALNRPVRAYITDQDLSKSESERNALSLKTSY